MGLGLGAFFYHDATTGKVEGDGDLVLGLLALLLSVLLELLQLLPLLGGQPLRAIGLEIILLIIWREGGGGGGGEKKRRTTARVRHEHRCGKVPVPQHPISSPSHSLIRNARRIPTPTPFPTTTLHQGSQRQRRSIPIQSFLCRTSTSSYTHPSIHRRSSLPFPSRPPSTHPKHSSPPPPPPIHPSIHPYPYPSNPRLAPSTRPPTHSISHPSMPHPSANILLPLSIHAPPRPHLSHFTPIPFIRVAGRRICLSTRSLINTPHNNSRDGVKKGEGEGEAQLRAIDDRPAGTGAFILEQLVLVLQRPSQAGVILGVGLHSTNCFLIILIIIYIYIYYYVVISI